jgi:hypothetical protein
MPKEVELFEERLIRRVWHKDERYYSIVDVVTVLTGTPNPNNYWHMLDQQVQTEGFRDVLKHIEQLKLPAADNRLRLTDTYNRQTLLRLIQSIPSPKAEPFRLWLAQVGGEGRPQASRILSARNDCCFAAR